MVHGIEEDDLKRIFEPFYSKKEMGRSGSGLGLSILYGIVRDHCAYIDVHSEIGVGSEFVAYFPVTREAVQEKPEVTFDCWGSESILVVDDVEQQREVVTKLLSSLGYNVVTAENGRAAVKYLRNARVDLVLLDMIMEEDFDGLDTYRQIIEIHPEQKAIIVSGFSETGRVKKAQALGVGRYVRKPYTLDKIGRAVRAELDRK
jgi:CheY-like chemotaxis protein